MSLESPPQKSIDSNGHSSPLPNSFLTDRVSMRKPVVWQELAALMLGFLLLLTACNSPRNGVPSPVSDGDSPAIWFTQGSANTSVDGVESTPSGGAYLVLTTAEPPYLHRLVRVPTACLLNLVDCPPPEVISAYPKEGITPSHLHWAPNGQEALILDTYEPRILRFDPSDASLTTLMKDVPTIRDNLAYLSDGRAVFIIQGAGDFASELVALNRGDGTPQLQRLARFDGIAYLLGIDSAGRVLISLDIYGFPVGGSSLKKEVVDVRLLLADPVTKSVTEVWDQVDWLSQRPQSLFSDGRQLISGSNRASLWDLQIGEETLQIGTNVNWLVGSPDKHWLTFVERIPGDGNFEIRVVDIQAGEKRSLAKLPVSPKLFWTPDSRFIVMARLGLQTSATLGSLRVATPEGSTVITPRLDLGEYPVVEDVSWGP